MYRPTNPDEFLFDVSLAAGDLDNALSEAIDVLQAAREALRKGKHPAASRKVTILAHRSTEIETRSAALRTYLHVAPTLGLSQQKVSDAIHSGVL